MKIKDKEFDIYLNISQIEERISQMGHQISNDYTHCTPLFVGILNGAFMFASQLFKHLSIQAEITFIKLSSYNKLNSSGQVTQLLGLNETLFQRDVIILEDIVDTGTTMVQMLTAMDELRPKSVEIATLLFKPDALVEKLDLKYVGFEIPDRFVVGYGLDYAGLGRNLPDIYQLKS